ncbi:TPA: hypothetical protein QDE31_27675 [Burkholderia cenocepacia]|nr:hypothetical protein [Burkholderia cenocepacia]
MSTRRCGARRDAARQGRLLKLSEPSPDTRANRRRQAVVPHGPSHTRRLSRGRRHRAPGAGVTPFQF